MSWLEPSTDQDVSIGILPKESPEVSNVREAYHKSPEKSIVRQITTNLTVSTYGNIPRREKENIHYIFADLILQLFWSYKLNPNILTPELRTSKCWCATCSERAHHAGSKINLSGCACKRAL